MLLLLNTLTAQSGVSFLRFDEARQVIQNILGPHGNQIPIVASAVFLVIAILIAWRERRGSQGLVAEIGGWWWTREAFCCGWLVTGGVGTGKAISGRNTLLYQVFEHQKNWGGLVIDDKGLDWETLQAMARHFGRQDDLVLLRLNDENGQPPSCRFNLTSDRRIPFSTYGRIVVDVAVSLGQNRDQSFFRAQAQTHISSALAALHLAQVEVSLENAFNLLLEPADMEHVLAVLGEHPSPEAGILTRHFTEHYAAQPPEQLGGVKGTIFNYLNAYTTPEVGALFCRDSTFKLDQVDQGKIFCLALPQRFAIERRFAGTFLKQLFYLHALRRFDRPAVDRAKDNLLILWADEAQHFITAGEDGWSDYNAVDRIREARATAVFVTQSGTSFIPPVGKDKAKVLTLNLRNRLMFAAADEADAQAQAEFIGSRGTGSALKT